jgi:hypothetical protein
MIVGGAAAVMLSACIPSVKPFYTQQDLVMDSRLLGTWQAAVDSDGPRTWRFEQNGDDAYQLTVTEEGDKTGKFTARLFRLEQELFLDLVPAECEFAPSQADLVNGLVFPGHMVMWVAAIEPELKLAFLDFEWLGDHLEENPQALAHHNEEDRLLLTADTPALQRFVLRHRKELFKQPEALSREPDAPSPAIP